MKRWCIPLLVALAGCRGQASSDPPIHLFGDMDWQPKFQPEEGTSLFPDGRAMRPLVQGTVAQGSLDESEAFRTGKDGEAFVAMAPITVDEAVIRRGRDRFNIYCTPCHDHSGSGQGMVVKRGYPPPIDLASDRARGLPDGEIFNVITNGVRNMPSYRKQIPVRDRWAIVTWVRVLQRSQHARIDDVPEGQRGNIVKESGTP
ncbi:c-type cytochrome [Sorangium sp. So ce131]|uniref:c-type cytochrome n=1 Tax=Sorangium sp. So ce131 TaxID=3133282 RepID=UPI003F5E206D